MTTKSGKRIVEITEDAADMLDIMVPMLDELSQRLESSEAIYIEVAALILRGIMNGDYTIDTADPNVIN